MNKSILIDLIEQTIKVTGDVVFADSQRTLLEAVGQADLNSSAICTLITEANAYSNIIFGSNCLPFLPTRKNDNGEYLLLSDFDGQVNFRRTGNATLLMILVKAVETVFGKRPLVEMEPINEADIDQSFSKYAAQFDIGLVISPIERAEYLTVELAKQQLSIVSGVLSEIKVKHVDELSSISESDLAIQEDHKSTEQLPHNNDNEHSNLDIDSDIDINHEPDFKVDPASPFKI